MPLVLAVAVIAVAAALALRGRRGPAGQGLRFVGIAAGLWVAMIILAVVVLTFATLIFGR